MPLFGDKEKIDSFFAANKIWLKQPQLYIDDLRHLHKKSSWTKKVREWILGGAFGDLVEKVLRKIQISRIAIYLI